MTNQKYIDIYKSIFTSDKLISCGKKGKIYNVACSFDIETSSFYDEDDEKVGLMYIWMLEFENIIIYGRIWEEFIFIINSLSDFLKLNSKKKIIIYIHNLAFEFQFFHKYFTWDEVFATDSRKPLYCRTTNGIEFRCSFFLSGCNLDTVAKNLKYTKINKLVGNLDYEKIRTAETPLTTSELEYCFNDVKIVVEYIHEKIQDDGNISKIQLTKTGYVRKYCRDNCYYSIANNHKRTNKKKYFDYRKLMKALTLDVDEYMQLKRCFMGGFTHCNMFYSNTVQKNVSSFDFTSSYPTVMVAEQFPMSKAERYKIKSAEDFKRQCDLYCCVFDVTFYNIKSKNLNEHPISTSKCYQAEKMSYDNGRLIKADKISTTITNVDYQIYKAYYKWEKCEISNFIRYKKGYLPTAFVKSILELYQKKTTLKNVEGSENEYMLSKELLNSCYGMIVTDIAKDEQIFDNGNWDVKKADVKKLIEKYNGSKNRFLFYPWGIFVTAYARYNLFTGIFNCGNDYIYSDTDSIKIMNMERYSDYFNRYNESILNKLKKACEWHKIDISYIEPKTVKGISKPLGVWDFEGTYSRFKSCGAKRYMIEKNNDIDITISGLNKKTAVPYILSTKKDPFIFFNDEMEIPKDYTGKLTHSYIDEERNGYITDYLGNEYKYKSLSGIHLEKSAFSMSLAENYKNLLTDIGVF